MNKIIDISVFGLDIELAEPFKISFKTFTHLNNLLIVVKTDDGYIGYGEAAPFKPITGDSRKDAIKYLSFAVGRLLGKNIDDVESMHRQLLELDKILGFTSQTAKAAIDMAIFDIVGKMKNLPIYKILGVKEPRKIPNTLTIGIKSLEDTIKTVKHYMKIFGEMGLKRLKLKLSGDKKSDYERVSNVLDIFDGEVTLDANQAFVEPKEAVELFKKFEAEFGDRIILIEEPCPKGDLDKMKYVRDHVDIPIFADESASTFEDAKKVIEYDAADGINIKIQKAGGIFWGKKIAELARENKLSLMVGCMLETSISISAGIHFASSIEGVINTDLDSDITLPYNIIKREAIPKFENGFRKPNDLPGLGVVLEDWVEKFLRKEIYLNKII